MGEARGRWFGAGVGGVATAVAGVLGASGLPAADGWPVGVLAVVVGLVIAVVAVRRFRREPAGDRSLGAAFRTRRYRVVLAAEIVAIAVGTIVLRSVGLDAVASPWVALVVGVHFLAFGRLFGDQRPLGGGLVVAALVGAVVGLESSGGPARATTWLLGALVFLAYAGVALVHTPRPRTA